MQEGSKQLRFTIDTNNVISGTISPGNYASHLLASWSKGAFAWIQTSQTFHEVEAVLHREKFRVKYGFQQEEIQAFLSTLATGATFVTAMPLSNLPLHSRDKKDDIFLACALSGECDYLITSDEDLLVLNGRPELETLHIVPAEKFLKEHTV